MSSNPETEALTMYIAAVIRREMENFHHEHLSDAQMKELNPIIRNAVFTALIAFQGMDKITEARDFVSFYLQMVPDYWEEPTLTEEFRAMLQCDAVGESEDDGAGNSGYRETPHKAFDAPR